MLHALLNEINIETAWSQIEKVLAPAISRENTHNPEDVKQSLLSGLCQVFVQFEDRVTAALVTEFIKYPRVKRLRIWLVGAEKRAKIDWDKFQEIVVKYALDNGCKEIEVIGRIGWGARYPKAHKTNQEFVYKLTEE